MSREVGIELARRVRAELGRPIGKKEFLARSGLSRQWLVRHFGGRWTELREAAGLERHPRQPVWRSDEELLADFHRAAEALGRVPAWKDLPGLTGHGDATYWKRFGNKLEMVTRYREWLEARHPDSGLLAGVRAAESQARLRRVLREREREAGGGSESRGRRLASGSRMEDRGSRGRVGSGRARGSRPAGGTYRGAAGAGGAHRKYPVTGGAAECGEPIDFRAMRHAPVNEQGVLVLFGMMAEELGFLVELVRNGFPDCEAKRSVNAAGSGWRHVRIEFEYRSRNFREHGHDPAGCDLVVCWVHDWAECPVEVLELRAVAGWGGGRG